MKLLLTAINAKYIHSNLAVYSLKAYAKEYASCVELVEFTINHRREYILQEIYKKKPDVLCFSCYIWNYEYVKEVAQEFHKLCPDVPIWVGGPEVSYEIEQMFEENPAFFGVMIGEGEATFKELTAYYCGLADTIQTIGLSENKNDEEKSAKYQRLYAIKGLAFRTDISGSIHKTPMREPLDLNTIPFCYEELTDFKNRIIYYESSRGCPFSCSYCLSSVDKQVRFRDMELVKQELQFFIEQEVPQVKFVDRTFNLPKRGKDADNNTKTQAMEIWQFIKEHDRGITNFHFEIAADLLQEEELALLSTLRPGLVQLEIGVQSTNEDTIKEIHRAMQLSHVESAVKAIQKAGNIHEHLDLIAGLPYESFARFAKSFNDIYALKPNQLQLGFLKVLKGSYMFEHSKEYGMIYQSRPPYEIRQTKWMSYEEILKIKLVEEMLEVYYNSGQFEITMKLMDVVYEDAFEFFLKLGKYYEKKGYLAMNHSRIRRCEILLDFALEDDRIDKVLLEQGLLYDLYYRENCKSRPYWAKNPSTFSKFTRTFCKNGKMTHIEPFFYHFPGKEEKILEHLPKRLEEEVFVLFEYEKRDALDHQAKTTEITMQEAVKQWESEQMRF